MELSIGKDLPVCRAVLANINLANYPALVRGEWQLNLDTSIATLEKPDWQTVDIAAHRDALHRFFLHHAEFLRGDPESSRSHLSELEKVNGAEIEARIDREIATGEALLQVANIDFDGDGHIDQVFRYSDKLRQHPSHQLPLFIPGRYWQLIVNLGNPENTIKDADYLLHRGGDEYDVFIFENRTYLIDSAFGYISVHAPSYIQRSQSLKTTQIICSLIVPEKGEAE